MLPRRSPQKEQQEIQPTRYKVPPRGLNDQVNAPVVAASRDLAFEINNFLFLVSRGGLELLREGMEDG